MLTPFLIIWQSIITRAAGAKWNRIPQWAEVAFAVPFSIVAYQHTGMIWVALLGAVLTYLAFQTGHGNFYEMKGVEKDEPEHIEYLVREFYHGDIHKPLYSWICMGLKGLFIGLAAFPLGLSLAVLWPLSYWLSFKYTDDSAKAEYLVGAWAGLILGLSL